MTTNDLSGLSALLINSMVAPLYAWIAMKSAKMWLMNLKRSIQKRNKSNTRIMGISLFIAKSSCSISQNAVSAHIPAAFRPVFSLKAQIKNTKETMELQRENEEEYGFAND